MIAEEPQKTEPEAPPAVDELRALVDRARQGDHDALPRLRELLDERPGVFGQFGDLARHAQAAWVKLAAGGDLAFAEALRRRADAMTAELAGAAPTELERLLVERVAATWLQANYADAAAAQTSPEAPLKQVEFTYK